MAELVEALRRGVVEVTGEVGDGNNLVLVALVSDGDRELPVVYKPRSGERRLWDFPSGNLAGREVAAFRVAEMLGWPLVPPTVLRDGPLGVGSVQLWVSADVEAAGSLIDVRPVLPQGWRAVVAGRDEQGRDVLLGHADAADLRRLALLDAVTNNADRKASHVLVTGDGAVFGIDHGLTFNESPKLRSVLWGFAGDKIDADSRESLQQLADAIRGDFGAELVTYLTDAEVAALADRVASLLHSGVLPGPSPDWPALPWPIY